ncbi:SCO4225 family membrane protein [Streptomyces sp. NPDC020681]|uniref:SCO4225 family membrane protein n=1 Tax=Streptomyces sp. NPDC020681 TaxID=3365083 RepID=UPI0037A3D559
MNSERSERLGALTRLTFGSRVSQVYLALVAVAAVYVAVDAIFVHHEDASFAGVWLFALTAPTVFVFLLLGDLFGDAVSGASWFVYTALVLSVLIQSAALGWFGRLLRGRPRSAHPQGA